MDTTDIMKELRELREPLDDFPVSDPPPKGSLPEMVILKDPPQNPSNIKPTSFPIYNGDRVTHPAWRRTVLSATKIDWNTFGCTNSRVFLMIYKALEGKAQKQAGSFFEMGGIGGSENPKDFIEFLDQGNWGQTRLSRANSELNEMRMEPKQRWSQFYCLWAKKLTEAAGDTWPDDVKVSLLRTTLNINLRVALASNHLILDDDFSEFVRIVSKIAHQHDEIPKPATFYQGGRQATLDENQAVMRG